MSEESRDPALPAPPVDGEPTATEAGGDPAAAAPRLSEEERRRLKQEKKLRRLERKQIKKEERRREEAVRPVDAWERYRALLDTVKGEQDLLDFADHKVRFALIIMGALNTGLAVLGTRTDIFQSIPARFHTALAGYLLLLALVALFFFFQAVESLRPRKAPAPTGYPYMGDPKNTPLGLRYHEDILRRDAESYGHAWREVRIGQINAELTLQAYSLAKINDQKYAAVRRLFVGLKLQMGLAGGLIAAIMLANYSSPHGDVVPMPAKKHAARFGGFRGGLLFGAPERFTDIGTREPSGIVYHPKLGHLFLVGDEGMLVELDKTPRVIRTQPIKGNLEEVTLHTPTGNLLMISEKLSELIYYDPVQKTELKRWLVDMASLLGEEPVGDRNHGFEGLGFREDPGFPGGGVFYLARQKAPNMVIGFAFDPASAPAGRLKPDIVSRWHLSEANLKSAFWAAPIERFLVISKKGLTVIPPDGNPEATLVLPGDQPEGVCLDDQGTMWVADDRGKALLKFRGALERLKERFAGEAESTESGATSH